MKHNMGNNRIKPQDEPSPDEQWLDNALNSVPDAKLPSHLVARLVDIPRSVAQSIPQGLERSKSWWPFGSWLPVFGWAMAAAAGIVLGVSGPAQLLSIDNSRESEVVQLTNDTEQDETDEWQELAQLALDSNWALED